MAFCVPVTRPLLTAAVPQAIPTVLTAGDTWRWDASFSDYPKSDGWVLCYAFRGVGSLDVSGSQIVVNASDPAGFSVTVLPASTAPLGAGRYRYLARVTLAGEVRTVDAGVVQVLPDLATADEGELQTHAEKMVALLEAAIEANAASSANGGTGGTVLSYSIADRSVTFRDEKDLRDQLARYKWQVWRERNPGKIGVKRQARFVG